MDGGAEGRVVALWRYPVKSMAGEELAEADLGWNGLDGDRRWAFVRPDQRGNGFPWLTVRQQPRMLHFRPALTAPERPERSGVRVTTPDGEVFEVTDPALAAQLGDGVQVMRQNRGTFDAAPISLLSLQSLAALRRRLGEEFDARRFRPNLVVDVPGTVEFPEEAWVGRSLRIGSAVIRIDRRDERCAVVNVNPDTLAREARVLRSIASERDLCFGVYGSVATPGHIRVGDRVVP
jgi:uncharacterized protein